MASGSIVGATNAYKVWLISDGRTVACDKWRIPGAEIPGSVKEYRISDLAKYLLDPNPIEVMNRLVGYKISYRQPPSKGLGSRIRNLIPRRLRHWLKPPTDAERVVLSDFRSKPPALQTAKLQHHVNSIIEALVPFDGMIKTLDKLDRDAVDDLVGICEDLEGNGTMMRLSGQLEDKIAYIRGFALKKVGVILEKAQFKSGLFEMRGFDFKAFDPEKSHRMIQFSDQGRIRAFVLSPDDTPQYEIEDIEMVKFLYLLDMSLKADRTLQAIFRQCVDGGAKPLKMFFTSQMEVDYSRENLPAPYREVLDASDAGPLAKDIVARALNQRQHAISLNYMPLSAKDQGSPHTSIYIIHDVRALEPIKSSLPKLYDQISAKLLGSDKGPYYLMDAIGEVPDA
jgi:hypothetical protein